MKTKEELHQELMNAIAALEAAIEAFMAGESREDPRLSLTIDDPDCPYEPRGG